MNIVTICLLVKETEGKIVSICLGMKKRGFGKGKWNGFGGKVGDKILGETPYDAAVREVKEEAGVTVEKIKKVAELTFSNPEGSKDVVKSYVYLIDKWDGEITESDEMKPQWFAVSDIPYDTMWSADRYWMPKVLQKELVRADFYYDEDDNFNHDAQIITVDQFSE